MTAFATAGLVAAAPSDDRLTLADLARHTHFHGIAVHPADPSQLYLATHHGFFMVGADGTARRLSQTNDDFMGFTPHPRDAAVLYASGHPAHGGNLGFIVSRDGGKTWRPLSKGANGPVDFHQMTVSAKDPNTIYGADAGALQVSRDGGRSWRIVGAAPAGLIDLAASTVDSRRLYAATEAGLLISDDSGKSWRPAHVWRRPASMVEVTADGRLYAFVVGVGLMTATEPALAWRTVSEQWGDNHLFHLAADPTDPETLYAIPAHGGLMASRDGGKSWAALGDGLARP